MSIKEEALHAGEIYHLWSYLKQAKFNNVFLQILINHTENETFKNFIEEIFENVFESEEQQVEIILKELGIRLPQAPPDRPHVAVEDIPAGARFNDPEIAHLLENELSNGKLLCSLLISTCTKDYLEDLFHQAISLRVEYKNKLHQLTKKNGWFISPPVHIK